MVRCCLESVGVYVEQINQFRIQSSECFKASKSTKTCCFLHRRSKAIKWLKQIRGGRKHSGFKLLFVGTSGLRLANTTWGFDNNLTMFFLYFDWLSLSFYIDQYFFHQVFVYLWIVVFGGFGAAGTFQPTWYQSCAGSGWKELLDKYLFEFSHSHFTFTFIHSLQYDWQRFLFNKVDFV